jgi:hypothetical protein
MKKIDLTVIAILFFGFVFSHPSPNGVDRVIGDESFVKTFHRLQGTFDDENIRIAAHLAYVEKLLSQKSAGQLKDQQQANRKRISHS